MRLISMIIVGALALASVPQLSRADAPSPLSQLQCAAVYGGQVQFPATPRSTAAEAARLSLISTYAHDNGLLPDMVTADVAAAQKSLHHELFVRVLDRDLAMALCDKQFGFSVAKESNSAPAPVAPSTFGAKPFAAQPDSLQVRMQKWAKEPATGFVSSSCAGLSHGIRLTKSMGGADVRDIAQNAGCSAEEINSLVENYEASQNMIHDAFGNRIP